MSIWTRLSPRSQILAMVWFFPAVLIGLGLFWLIAGLLDRAAIQPFDGGVTTTGTVVGDDTHYGPRGGSSTTPKIQFTDLHGVRHTFDAPSANGSGPAIGQAVTVSYPPGDPSQARDISAKTEWELEVCAGFVCLLVMPCLALCRRVRRGRWARRSTSD